MPRKPRPLRPGDLVAVCSPAGPVGPADRWDRLAARLARRGYRVRLGTAARDEAGFLAGPDERRLADLQEALDDRGVAAVICSRGGYGSMRILQDLRVPDRVPPAFVGFSDITAVHMRLLAEGWVAFHGPMAATDLGAPRPHGPSLRWLWDLLEGRLRPPLELPAPMALRPGRARGRLAGGNLTLLAALAGTGLLPDLRGAVLALEDVGEEPYRVDRMLTQLRLAGALEGVTALVAGGFSFSGKHRDRLLAGVHEVLADTAARLDVPCAAGAPFGHDRENLALPLGVEVEVDPGRGVLTVVEDWLER